MGVLVRVCVQKRELARMSLPFLPLCPTGMPGTNQAESGPSSFPMDPPTPAAAAAMDEALGTNEIVALIMTNLRAGDEDGAIEQACNAVATWLGLNKQHDGVSGSDEAMWEMLMQNIFPDAPAPTMHSVYNPESAMPESHKEWFYAMCKRHQLWLATEQRYEALKDQLLAAKRRESDAEWGLWRFLGAYQAEELSSDPKLDRLWKKLERKLDRATYDRHQLEKEKTWFDTHDLLDARERMQKWDVVPRSLRLQRQGAVPPERPESPLRPDDSSSSSSDNDNDDDDDVWEY